MPDAARPPGRLMPIAWPLHAAAARAPPTACSSTPASPSATRRAIIPYLHDLGVTHLYASPLLAARPGSTHGYDIIDHGRLNPEIGTEDDFDALGRRAAASAAWA